MCLPTCTDGPERLRRILDHAKEEQVDFIVSLGDLCFPTEEYAPSWKCSRTAASKCITPSATTTYRNGRSLRFLKKERPYEVFEAGEYRFIILDTCYLKTPEGEFHFPNRDRIPSRYPVLPEEQLKWLESLLSDGKKTIVFSHMSLVNPFMRRGIANKDAVQQIFEGKNVLLCMNGHDHGSDLKWVGGVPYCTVSSASQFCWWCVEPPPEVKNLFYKDPLHVIADLDEAEIRIQGMESEFMDIKPEDVGITDYRWNGVDVHPCAKSCVLRRK